MGVIGPAMKEQHCWYVGLRRGGDIVSVLEGARGGEGLLFELFHFRHYLWGRLWLLICPAFGSWGEEGEGGERRPLVNITLKDFVF